MKQKIILNTIIDEIYRLESYIQGWRDSEVVPSIERDLIQRKLQDIYDQLMHLNVTALSGKEVKPQVTQPLTKSEPVAQEVPQQEMSVPGPVKEIVFEKTVETFEETTQTISEIPLRMEPLIEMERINEITEPVKEVIEVKISKTETVEEKPKSSTKEILAEKLSHQHKLIHETIKTNTVMDVSSKLKNAPIPSIQSAINLNDKFLFIRELFKNNNLLYNQTIERLNNAAGYSEAISIIEREFAWNMDEPMVAKLVELIKRRHNA